MEAIIGISPLDFQWETEDPFLFCAHHLDFYPIGNEEQGPNAPLFGRRLGQDFDLTKSWKMYHGQRVPGFPEHPHRGFETVTITLEGIIDHFDSLWASGRYGNGDVQWMTAGSGCQHAEMFPLVHKDKPNTLHLFQIWLNLPQKSKFVAPSYKMLWNEELKRVRTDNGVKVTLIAGEYMGVRAIDPTPDSWANNPNNHVDIFLVEMDEKSEYVLFHTSDTINRNVYFYKGSTIEIKGVEITPNHRIKLNTMDVTITNTGEKAYLLVLQGEPILEPVVKYGPFVMNTEKEIQEAYNDYQRTQFGGWPWDRSDPVFSREQERIANYSDGSISYPPK